MRRMTPTVELRLDPLIDPAAWSARHRRGEVPDRLPYGLDMLDQFGVTVAPRQMTPLSGLARRLERRLHLHWRQAAHRTSADAILCWDERSGAPSALLARKPVMTGAIWATDDPTPAVVWGLRRAAAVFALSSGQLPRLREMGVRRALHIPMGIDAEFFPPAKHASGRKLLSVGNDRHRDWDTLLRAFAELADPLAELEVITRRPVPPGEGVTVTPHVTHPELRDRYADAAVVVVPLRPNLHVSGMTTILEAMASARPVVACETAGIRDYVEDGVTGLLVPPGDPASLAAAVRGLLADPDRAEAMGDAGRRAVEQRFTTARQAADLSAVLRGI